MFRLLSLYLCLFATSAIAALASSVVDVVSVM